MYITNTSNKTAIRKIENAKYPSKRQFAKYSSLENERLYDIAACSQSLFLLLFPVLPWVKLRIDAK